MIGKKSALKRGKVGKAFGNDRYCFWKQIFLQLFLEGKKRQSCNVLPLKGGVGFGAKTTITEKRLTVLKCRGKCNWNIESRGVFSPLQGVHRYDDFFYLFANFYRSWVLPADNSFCVGSLTVVFSWWVWKLERPRCRCTSLLVVGRRSHSSIFSCYYFSSLPPPPLWSSYNFLPRCAHY